ncbi:hypothetical protein P4S72_12940 [Vibrio sp. PP-XX7]
MQKVIDRTPVGMNDEEIQASRERLEKLKLHPRDALPNITLMEKLNRLYEEKLAGERYQIEQLILYFTRILETQDDQQVSSARKQVETELQSLGWSS